MNDDAIIPLLTEIRDLQRQQLELARQTLNNQQQALANQSQAITNQQASAQRAVESQKRWAEMWDRFGKQEAKPWWKRFLYWLLIALMIFTVLETVPGILLILFPGHRH